ncbi:MAG: STN domain-containing protein [Verrucomicrobia bacterium]|nr:STN domain-containing protein [Verrucomicrobiota bacterium]
MAERLRLIPALAALCLALFFPPLLRAADAPATLIDFDLPAGDAESTLRAFGRQSGLQILFPTDLVRGLRTGALAGRFTPRDALHRLLAGTPLTALFDAGTGTFSLVRGELSGRLVELPPYVVEASTYPPWSYAQLPGFEVLSRCSDEATERLITDSCRLLDLLDELLLPRNLQVRHDIPTCFVLYDEAAQPAVARDFIAEIQRRETLRARESAANGAPDVLVRALPNYRFWDRDSLTIYYLRGEYDPPIPRQTLSPAYLEYLLRNRTPSLPPWFIEGMLEFYRSVDLGTGAIGSLSLSTAELSRYNRQDDACAVVRPMEWISPAATAAVRKRGSAAGRPPPATALFAEFPADGTPADRQRWRSHAALFIRWTLSDPTQARRSALWDFVDRASRQPAADEALFRQCFGLSYAALDRQLADALRSAVKDKLTLRPAHAFPAPEIKLRVATESEVSRIQGGLNYLEVAYAQEFFPDLKPRYLAQARRTLRLAYDNGDRDPQLLALLGLCECDAGDDAAARPFLAAAIRDQVVRPRAYYEFARIRFDELRAAHPASLFTAAEAAELLRPLHAACRQSPPLPEVYDLIAFIWLNTETHPSLSELAVLDEGIARFPRRVRLLHSTALLNARQGYVAAAQKLLTRALAFATNPADRDRLLALQATLDAK